MRRSYTIAIVLAVAVRVLLFVRLPSPHTQDSATIVRLAENLASGHGFVDKIGAAHGLVPTAQHPVGYPALVALFQALFDWINLGLLTPARFINLLGSVSTAVLCAVLGYRSAGDRGFYVAAVAYSLAPGPALWTLSTSPENVATALMMGSIVSATRKDTAVRSRVVWSGVSGLFVGLCAYFFPAWIFAAPFLPMFAPSTRSTKLLSVIVCVAVAMSVQMPWMIRNAYVFHDGLTMVHRSESTLASTFAPWEQGTLKLQIVRECQALSDNEAVVDRCMAQKARERILRSPRDYARNLVLHTARTFGYEYRPIYEFRREDPGAFGRGFQRIVVICTVSWLAIVIASVIGARRILRIGGRPQLVAQCTLVSVGLTLIHALTQQGDDRLHLFATPLLCVLASGIVLPSQSKPGTEWIWAGSSN